MSTLKSHVDVCVPASTVNIGPRDPSYISPAIKVLLTKRRKLHRNGSTLADSIAEKINILIRRESRLLRCPMLLNCGKLL